MSLNILPLIASFFFYSLKIFLMVLFILPSDCFCIFNLLGLFPLPCMVCLPYSSGVFVLKGLTTLSLKPPTVFLWD